MNGRGRPSHISVSFASEVIRVDLDSYSRESRWVYVRQRTNGCEGLRQCDRRASVKKTEGLTGSHIYRHGSRDALRAQFCDSDTQRVLKAARVEIVQPGEPVVRIFDHPES